MKRIALFRIWIIVTMFARFIIRLYAFSRKQQQGVATTEEYEALMLKLAREYKRNALRLEGLLIKLGQFLSIRADLLPPAVLNELSELVDRVPTSGWEKSRAILEAEWGVPYSQVVKDVGIDAVASASIGEVYGATLLENGKRVAIKIQRPNIEKIIRTDFRAMRIVTSMLKRTSLAKSTDLDSLYRQMIFVIGDELNFQTELKNALYFKAKYADNPDVYIPDYHEHLCTNRVLTMDWVDARRITDLAFLKENDIDRSALAERLFTLAAEQLLFGGQFHADPHPGNVQIRADGTIILLDFGMVGQTTAHDMATIRNILQAFISLDYDSIVDGLEDLRFLLPTANKQNIRQALEKAVTFYLETDIDTVDTRLIEKVLQDIQLLVKNEPIQLPAEFAFFGRAASTLLGILQILDPKIDLFTLGKPIVIEWLEEDGTTLQNRYVKTGINYAKKLLNVPPLLDNYLKEPTRKRLSEQAMFQRNLESKELLHRQTFNAIVILLGLLVGLLGYIRPDEWLFWSGGVVSVLAYFNWRRLGRKIRHLARQDFRV
ncbi:MULTISPECIES: ABC1 kinase family protein [Exiguobacterium]|jgi:predicted unusual protein kinase regulating ubiquinone biosynthesis (AarF/ABC1/UbiB family)|uniref:ABC1 kinase family protein n=1 Tax=Exiguobacterium TaxID=33986 RepID=UPI001BECE38F|nr:MULTISPECIES: AarF/UbiB family protein [Exiguobacterium]MCA0981462.1 AarF/ABC1/UbiB kinase family protein [Exiguobacterium aestuarii]